MKIDSTWVYISVGLLWIAFLFLLLQSAVDINKIKALESKVRALEEKFK